MPKNSIVIREMLKKMKQVKTASDPLDLRQLLEKLYAIKSERAEKYRTKYCED